MSAPIKIEVYEWDRSRNQRIQVLLHGAADVEPDQFIATLQAPTNAVAPMPGDILHLYDPREEQEARWRVVERELLWHTDGTLMRMWIIVRSLDDAEYETSNTPSAY